MEWISVLDSEKPDIAILDIKLSESKTRIDLANEINKTYSHTNYTLFGLSL